MKDTEIEKYVIHNRDGEEKALLFPSFKQHRDTAIFEHGLSSEHIVAAGFYYVSNGEVFTDGNSLTLNIGGRPEDKHVILKALKQLHNEESRDI